MFAFRRASRLNPVTPMSYLNGLGWTYLLTGQPEKALKVFDNTLARYPEYLFAALGQVAAHAMAGRKGLAQRRAADIRLHFPRFRLMQWADGEPYRNPEDLKPIVAALSSAGLQ